MTKTCEECLYYDAPFCDYHAMKVASTRKSCDLFDPKEKPPTNGDKIRQGGDEALIDFADGIRKRMCHYCIFSQEKSCVNKTNDCWDGVMNWLKQEAKDE